MDAHTLDCLEFDRIRELLAECAMTHLGAGLARSVRPSGRFQVVQRWLDQYQELVAARETIDLPPLGGVTDVRELVKRSEPPLRLSVEEVAQIGHTLAATHGVSAWLARLPENSPELRFLAERIGDFKTIADRIARVIDERSRVRDEASDKLRRIRRRIVEASAEIGEAVKRLLRDPEVTRLLQYHNHTFHGDRYVLPVRAECRGRVSGIIHRSSDSGATLYVEPAQVVELNNELSRLRADEQEEINRLLWELVHEVHINAAAVLGTLDSLAILDLVVAKLRFAERFELTAPKVNQEGRVSVRGARHPLLVDILRRRSEGTRPEGRASGGDGPGTANGVVPIDYRLGDDFDMLIITGPNTGGKTVTLKTVGLLCLMAQAGLPIPAERGADVGLFQNIMIDIGDEQSLQQSLSTFSAHLARIMDMLKRANRRTLVLIDELGAGTDPDEGAAIGRALLDELLRRHCRCVVSTHLGALKGYALARKRVENGSVEFDPITLRPTYHLRIGEPGNSNAIDIAQRLGMPNRVIAAARRNLARKGRELQRAIAGSLDSKRDAEAARSKADTARREAEDARGVADAARARFEQQQADFQAWVARVVHLRPGDAVRVRNFDRDGRIVRMQIDQQRAEVDVGRFTVEVPLGDILPPETPAPPPRPVVAAPAVAADRKPRSPKAAAANGPAASRQSSPPRPRPRPQDAQHPAAPPLTDEQADALHPGDSVYVKRFHREGRVVRVSMAKRVASVTVGVLEMELPFSGLSMPIADRRPPKPRKHRAAPASVGDSEGGRPSEHPPAAAAPAAAAPATAAPAAAAPASAEPQAVEAEAAADPPKLPPLQSH